MTMSGRNGDTECEVAETQLYVMSEKAVHLRSFHAAMDESDRNDTDKTLLNFDVTP